jgi:WD40 repeat protein
MSSLEFLAAIATIVGFFLVAFFGSKTIPELLQGIFLRRRRQSHKILYSKSTRLTTVSISTDGRNCAFGGFAKELHIMQLKTRKTKTIALHSETIRHIIHIPTTREVLSAGDDGCIFSIDRVTEKQRLIGKHACPVYCLFFHAPSGLVMAADKSGNLCTWELGGAPWQNLGETIAKGVHTPKVCAKSSSGSIFTICATKDGSTIFFAGVGGKVFTVHFATGAVSELVQHGEQTIFCMVYDDLRNTLFCGCADGAIRCYDTTSKKTILLQGHTDAVRWLVLDEACEHLFSSSKDKTIRRWHLRNENPTIVGSHSDYVYQIALSPGSGDLYSVGGDGKLIAWYLE